MGDPEHHDYVRLSDPIASSAFFVHPSGVSWLNLHWLVDVIQHYDASERRLADIPTLQGQLEHLRAVTQQVDDDRMAWFIRDGGRKTEDGGKEVAGREDPINSHR